MTSSYIAPLNLQYIFQNVLAGSPDIFLALFFIGISVVAGLFKMQDGIFLLMIGLASIMLYGWFGGGFYLAAIIIAGLIIFYGIKRIVTT